MHPVLRRNLSRILPFGLIWVVFSIVYLLLEKGLLGDINYYPSTGNPYSFSGSFLTTTLSALATGLFVGSLETLYLHKVFQKRSFTVKLVAKTGIYVFIMLSFLIITSLINNARELNVGLFNPQLWFQIDSFFNNLAFWSVQIYMAVIIGVTLFYNEVQENIGSEVLRNFLTGKYHTPVQEERIFMFLDMKSSTTIAEKLGHVEYFKMLQEYYTDLSGPITKFSGEIYQYVGDEIVVSWKPKNGFFQNNCLLCFFAMKDTLASQAEKYKEQYDEIPTFKAGLHVGAITTGEIGVIKKDIIFTGDVLNATARIQGLCNQFNTDLIISGQLLAQLDLSKGYQIQSLGANNLRGRDEEITLFSIAMAH